MRPLFNHRSSLWFLNLLFPWVYQTCGILLMNYQDGNVTRTPTYEEFMSQTNHYRDIFYNNYPANVEHRKSPPPPLGSQISKHSNKDFSHAFVMDTGVEIWLVIKRIVSIDLEKQSLTIIVDENFVWSDLSFKQEDNFNLTGEQFYEVVLDATQIWTPPIFPGNAISFKPLIDHKAVQVPPSGEDMMYHKVMEYTFPCEVDAHLFPFDKHNCTLVLTQPTRMDFRIAMSSLLENMSIEEIESSFDAKGHETVEWRLKGMEVFIRKRRNSGGSVYDPYDLDEFVFSVSLQRNAMFYASVLIFPGLLLNVLSLLVFSLPLNSDRHQYGVTLILAYFVLLASIVDASPNTGNSVPLLGIYMAVSTAIMVASFFLSIFLSVVNQRYLHKPHCCRRRSLAKDPDNVGNGMKFAQCGESFVVDGDKGEVEYKVDQSKGLSDTGEWSWLGKGLNFVGFLLVVMAHIITLVTVLCQIQ